MIAGAELDVSRIPEMGVLGLVYVVGRAGGKFAGARLAARWLGLEPGVRNFLGFALQAQAGLAVGLTLAVNGRYPQMAPVISTVVLASVVVFVDRPEIELATAATVLASVFAVLVHLLSV